MEEVIHEVAQHPFQIAAVSAVFWLALGLIIDQILAVIDHPALKDDPNDIRSRIISCIHAVVVGAGAFYAIYTSPEIWTDLFGGKTDFGDIVCYTFLGYCVYDTFNMLVWLKDNGIAMYFHHFLSIFAALVHYFSSAHMIMGMSALAMMEVTNPSLHTLYVMRKLKMDGSPLFIANALLFVGLYFAFRVVGCGYLSYRFYHMYSGMDLLWTYHSLSLWLFLLLTVLSYFWFYKIILMAQRVLKGKPSSQGKKQA